MVQSFDPVKSIDAISKRSSIIILLILISFLICGFVVAEEENTSADPFDSSLVRTQSLLSTIVDSVSVISGEWVQSETDFVIIGPEPLILSRGYSPDKLDQKRLGCNWDFHHPHRFVLEEELINTGDSRMLKAMLVHGPGITTFYETRLSKRSNPVKNNNHLYLISPKGTTNCLSGDISARTNPHNTILELDRSKKECSVITGSGQKTCYKRYDFKEHETVSGTVLENGMVENEMKVTQQKSFYGPLYDKKPNGNVFLFKENGIEAKNPSQTLCYGWIKFKTVDKELLKVEASDGKTGDFTFSKISKGVEESKNNKSASKHKKDKDMHGPYCLTKASFNHKPCESYEYTTNDKIPLLSAKRYPDDRFQSIEYYRQNSNTFEGLKNIDIKDKHDYRIGRVKAILRPVGFDNTPVVTHQFIYEREASKKRRTGGKTIVYDAYGRKMVYEYNEDHRPISIQRCDEDLMYSTEKYVWDDDYEYTNDLAKSETIPCFDTVYAALPFEDDDICEPSVLLTKKKKKSTSAKAKNASIFPKQKTGKGNLIGKYLQNKYGSIFHARYFEYDTRGNIVEERIYGNLTGNSTKPIILNAQQQPIPNGVESTAKTFTYSKDRFNLLLSEQEESGKGILYTYHKHSDLIAAKYITEDGEIRFREFYTYDESTNLIRLVKDDGSEIEENKLDNVNERHITVYHPRKEAPFGLPEMIEDFYWDPDREDPDKVEVLQKRVLCSQYSNEGYLEKQEHYDANGEFAYALFWEYDAHGNVIKETNAIGQVIEKTYDDNDNLKSEEGFGVKKIYHYDFSNRLIKEETTYSNGEIFVTAHRYDFIGNRIATTDRFGNETHFEYDSFNRLFKTRHPPIQDSEGNLVIPEMTIDYDCADRPILTTDPCGLQTKTVYNAIGKPILVTYPDGTIEKNEYDLDGTLSKTISPTGLQTVYTRDFLGRVEFEELYDENGKSLGTKSFTYKGSHLASQTDSEGCVTTFSYDRAGRVKKETRGIACTTYDYDSLGRLAKSIEWHGEAAVETTTRTYRYDKLNRLVEERMLDSEGHSLEHLFYDYDERGNVEKKSCITEAGESFVFVKYNTEDQPVEMIDAEGQAVKTTYHYGHINSLGQKVLQVIETDPLGRNTCKTFDAMGRLCEITVTNSLGVTLSQQQIDYDAAGRKIRTKDSVIFDGKVERSYVNAWSYHPSGQPEKMVEAVGTPEQKITTIQYNTFSQKEKVIKPDGIEVTHQYDVQGRLKALFSSDNTVSYTYEYDRNHRLRQVIDKLAKTKTEWDYDSNGHLVWEKLANGLGFKYDYDRSGRLLQMELPDESSVKYTYQSAFLKEVQRQRKDALLYTHQYMQYDQSGALLKSSLIGKSGTLQCTYDRIGRSKKLKHLHRVQTAVYDQMGRLETMEIQDRVGTTNYPFSYDELDHLETETGHTYKTDSLHNRIQKNETPYHVNVLNQLKEREGCKYAYHDNGSLKEKMEKGETGNTENTRYGYDALNRLVSVAGSEGKITYEYDVLNRRIAKTVEGKRTRYLYQGQNEIGSMNAEGEIIELRILGSGAKGEIGSAIAFELQDKTYAPLYDMGGHVAGLIDSETGEIAEIYRYTAFGEETINDENGNKLEQSEVGNPWRFSSKRVDPETGWVYFGMRYYDPEVGRWTTTDPAHFADGPNLYAYLHHRPLMACDVYGLYAEGSGYRDSVAAAQNSGNVVCSSRTTDGPLCFSTRDTYEWNNRSGAGEGESASYERSGAMGNMGAFAASIVNASFSQAPPGFVEKSWEKGDRLFYSGYKQMGGLAFIRINGILNTMRDVWENVQNSSEKLYDSFVTHVYNKSTNFVVTDLMRCFFELCFYMETESVKNLKRAFIASYEAMGPNGIIYHKCHSEGAIITRNALMKLPEHIRQRIIILAISPGAYIEDKYALEVFHLRSTHDFIPHLDFFGAWKCQESTTALKPHPEASLFDHSVNSKTFQRAENRIDRYVCNKYGGAGCAQMSI